jgi:hypothetical protein
VTRWETNDRWSPRAGSEEAGTVRGWVGWFWNLGFGAPSTLIPIVELSFITPVIITHNNIQSESHVL